MPLTAKLNHITLALNHLFGGISWIPTRQSDCTGTSQSTDSIDHLEPSSNWNLPGRTGHNEVVVLRACAKGIRTLGSINLPLISELLTKSIHYISINTTKTMVFKHRKDSQIGSLQSCFRAIQQDRSHGCFVYSPFGLTTGSHAETADAQNR